MATMTVSLPDPMKDWIEAQVSKGDYASASDYVRDLVRRDRARREQEFTLDDVRQIVSDSRASGVSGLSVEDVFRQAQRVSAGRGTERG